MTSSCHSISVTYVGPNVIIQCCCGAFHVVKRKEVSELAFLAASEHVHKNRPKDKYEQKYAHIQTVDATLILELRRKAKEKAPKRRYLPQMGGRQHGVSQHRGVSRKWR